MSAARIACPYCEVETVENRAVRGPLAVTLDPPALYWRDARRQDFTPTHCRLLHPLVLSGKASYLALLCTLRDETMFKAIHVHVHAIRRRMERLGLPVTLTALPRWGFTLTVDEEAS